ncbi:MAG: hypothetical protein Phog2KO_01550 [Phototrophicaceae bacterium]
MSNAMIQKLFFSLFIPVMLLGFYLRANDLNLYPPAISNDEAINAVDALHIARTGNFPMYEEDEGRAEPLFRIVEALGILAFGRTVWALRMVSVLLSMPIIALVIWITRECLYDYPRTIRLVAGLFAGVTIATLVGHVTLSRTLFRGILQLLTMGFSIGFILRGIRRNNWTDYALSGLFGGLTLYTYTASWFFPPAFIVLFFALILFKFGDWRQWLPKFIILGLVALIISTPIIYLLLTYPRAVLGRAEALSPNNTNFANSIRAMIDQFLVAGDENPQYNVALAPIIPPMLTWLFYIGLGTLLIRVRRVHSWFIVALLLLLTLPALLSNEITHGLRISGEYLVVPVIIGLGLGLCLWIIDKISKRPSIGVAIGTIGIFALGVFNGQNTWAQYTDYYTNPAQWRLWSVHEMTLNHNEWFFRVDRQDFGEWVSAQETPLLLPIEELNRQSTRTWLMDDYPIVTSADETITIPNNTQLVMPWSLERGDILRDSRQFALLQDDTIILLPTLSEETHQALISNIDDAQAITREGQIDFLGYVTSLNTNQFSYIEQTPVTALFNAGDIQLMSWSGDETISANQTLDLMLTWESLRQIGHEYSVSVQLQSQEYQQVANNADYLLRWIYPTSIWDDNLPVTTAHQLQLPSDLTSGAYQVTVGLSYASYPLIDVTSDTQTVIENRVTVGWLKVPQIEPTIPESAYELDVMLIDDLFQLSHIEFASADGQLLAQLHWQSLVHRPDIDATIFVHIVNSDNQIVAQSDSRPVNGQYPTFIWDEGEIIRTDHSFNFDDYDNLDEYTVRVGMYIFPSPQNLSASYQDQLLTDGLVTLGDLSDFFSD